MLDNDNNIPKKSPQSSGRSASNRTISIRQQGRASTSSRAEQETAAPPQEDKDLDALSSEFEALRQSNDQPSQHSTLFRTLSNRELRFIEGNNDDRATGDKGEVRTGTVKDSERGDANAVSKQLKDSIEVMREKRAADILYQTGLRDDLNIAYVYGKMDDDIVMKQYKPLPKIVSMHKQQVKDVVVAIMRTTTEMLKHKVRHNDMKIKNIMFNQDDDLQTPKIIDFGALTQASNENEHMLGLMDYKDRQESDMKPTAEKHSKSKTPEDVERYMFQNFVLNPKIRSIDPALSNNPAMAIYEILNIHKGLDPDKTMQQRARQIMAHEEELYIIHGAMRFIEKGGDISPIENIPDHIMATIKKDGKQPLHNLEERARTLAKTIKSDFNSLKVDMIADFTEPLD